MRSTFLTGSAAVAIGIVAIVVGAPSPLAQATQKSSPITSTPSARIAGQWRLNVELSTNPNDPASGGLPGSAGPGGGYGGGGGGYGGGGMGGRGGGGTGGGLGGFSRGSSLSSENTLRMKAMLREANQPAEILNIVISGATITFTNEEGVVRKYTANGKKEKVDLTTADVETTTSWDQNTLTQEMKAAQLKLTRSWQTSEQGGQLIVTVATQYTTKGSQPVTRKYVYDKSSGH